MTDHPAYRVDDETQRRLVALGRATDPDDHPTTDDNLPARLRARIPRGDANGWTTVLGRDLEAAAARIRELEAAGDALLAQVKKAPTITNSQRTEHKDAIDAWEALR